MGTHQRETAIEMDAGPERVWAILPDFAAYPEWNPFIQSVRGVPEHGARLAVRIQPSGTKGVTFRPTVWVADARRERRANDSVVPWFPSAEAALKETPSGALRR